MSATISRVARTCAPVSSHGSAALSFDVRSRRFTNVMPCRACRAMALARRCSRCTQSSSSNASRARPLSASSTLDGRWTRRSASWMPGRPVWCSSSADKNSSTAGSSVSRCFSMTARICLNDSPSVAGYTASTRPSAVPLSSAPRFTNSRGINWRP